MAVVYIIDSNLNNVNCARGVVKTGDKCTASWVPKVNECPLVVASGWDTRFDDICYYTACSGGL